MNQLLLTAADVKRLTTVGDSADTKKLTQAIPDATTRHLRPLLGPALLEQLLAFVVDYPEPPAANQPQQQAAAAQATYAQAVQAWRTAQATDPLLALLDKLAPCLAQWVYYEAWPDLLLDVTAAGPTVRSGNQQGNTRADADTLNEVRDAQRAKAIWRGSELVAWIEAQVKADKTRYPAYVSTAPPTTGAAPIDYVGGISL